MIKNLFISIIYLFYLLKLMIKIIHQIWFNLGNGKSVPLKYKKYQESWKNYHPNWHYILWDEKWETN